MKKFLFIILTCFFTTGLLSGCSEDSDDNKGTNDNTSVEKLFEGTYDVEFFATTPYDPAGAMDVLVKTGNMSTDCNKADELGILKKVDGQANVQDGQCAADGSNDAKLVGQQAVISYDETGLILETKLQMWSEVFSFSQDDVYQYTKYTAVPVADITDNSINESSNILGVSGRNLTTKTSNPKSTFKVTKRSDGTLYVELELIEKSILNGALQANAQTYVILRKKSDTAETVDPNSLFTTTSGIEAADKVYANFKTQPTE